MTLVKGAPDRGGGRRSEQDDITPSVVGRTQLRTLVGVATMALLAGGAGDARGNPGDVLGFGARWSARVGAGSASADDFAAAWYNPAGLAFGSGKRLAFGMQGAVSNLRIEDERKPISDGWGMLLGAALPAPLGGPLEDRVHLGIALFVLPGTAARIIARLPDEPFFPYYDNRLQRAVVIPALAVRIRPNLSVGVGVNFLATLGGTIQAAEGATRGIEARVDEEIPSIARIIAGVRYNPAALRDFDFALTIRQQMDIPFSTVAKTRVAGEPIDIDISASGVFTPSQVVAGASWHPSSRGELAADITYARWSAYRGPFVVVKSTLPLIGPLASPLPDVPYRDTVSLKLGGELRLGTTPREVSLRGGYGFETSPIPATQTGVTNLMDGNKHIVGAGVGVSFPLAKGRRLQIDVSTQVQLVSSRRITKTIYTGGGDDYDPFTALRDEVKDDVSDPATLGVQISNPGYPGLRSGGQVFSAAVTAGVSF